MAEYIKRDLALSAMNVVVTHANAIAGNSVILQKVCGILEDCKNIINDCPAADVAPVVHGRWEDVYGGKYQNKRYRCTVCKEKALFKFYQDELLNWHDEQKLSNYCPNCGARMDGVE